MTTYLIQAVRAGALALAVACAGCSSGGGGSAPLTLAVSVAGLNPGQTLVLQNNGGDSLTVAANGSHRFAIPVVNGAVYTITIATQPSGQTCFVTNGSGTVGNAGVTDISVACPHFIYVANKGSGDISAYRVDPFSGALAAVPGSPFAAGVGPAFVAIHPDGRHAYVANRGSRDISVFAIDAASGALAPIGTIAVAAGRAPVAIAFDPAGQRAYVAERDVVAGELSELPGSGGLSSHAIDAVTGLPIPGTSVPAADGLAANGIALDPAGTHAYVAEGVLFAGSVRSFGVAAGSGALTEIAGSPHYAPDAASIAVTPDGRFAYAASTSVSLHGYDPTVGLLHAFAIDSVTGALAPVGGSPLAFGDGFPGALAFGAAGRFVYVGDYSGRIHAFAADAVSGALAPVVGSPFAAGSAHAGIALDPAALSPMSRIATAAWPRIRSMPRAAPWRPSPAAPTRQGPRPRLSPSGDGPSLRRRGALIRSQAARSGSVARVPAGARQDSSRCPTGHRPPPRPFPPAGRNSARGNSGACGRRRR